MRVEDGKKPKKKDINKVIKLEDIYRTSKHVFKVEIKRAKAQSWDEFIKDLDRDLRGFPYRLVLKKLRRSQPAVTEVLNDNILKKTIDKLFPHDPNWMDGCINTLDEDWDELNSITI